MNKSKRGWNRCNYCGKFISQKDFNEDKIITSYTPDTSFSSENITYVHITCKQNTKRKNK